MIRKNLISKRYKNDGFSLIPLNDIQKECIERFKNDERIKYEKVEKCPLCDNTAFTLIAEKDRYSVPLETVVCDRCGLIFTYNRMTADSASIFYSEYYRTMYEGFRNPTKELLEKRYKAAEKRRIPKFLGQGSIVVEIGTGGGWNLVNFQRNGFEYYGFDYDENYINFARNEYGLNLYLGGVNEAKKFGLKADYIILQHTPEHTLEPLEFLRGIKDIMKNGAVMDISVPSANLLIVGGGATGYDLLGTFQNAHNFLFDEFTLKYLALKSGYSIKVALGELIVLQKKEENINSIIQASNALNNRIDANHRGAGVVRYLKICEHLVLFKDKMKDIIGEKACANLHYAYYLTKPISVVKKYLMSRSGIIRSRQCYKDEMKTFEFLRLILRTKKDITFVRVILFFSLALSLVEVAGVGTLFPFLNVIQNPNILIVNEKYRQIASLLHITSAGQFVLYFGLALLAIYLSSGILTIVVTYVQNYFAYKKQVDIATELLASYLEAPYNFHLDTNSSALIKNINIETVNIMLFLQQTLSLVLEFIILVFLIVFLFFLSWKVTAVLVICALLFHFGISKVFLSKVKSLGDKREEIQSKAFKYAQQALLNIKNIKVDNKSDYFVGLFRDNMEKIIKVGSCFRTTTVSPKAVVETVIFAGAIIFLLVNVKSVGFNPTLIPLIGVYGFAIYRIVPSVNRIALITMNMKFFKVSVDIVGCRLKEERLKKKKDSGKTKKHSLNSKISVRGLSFRYNSSSPYIFRGLVMDVYKGEKILIMGASGTGKSTFIDLLAGLLEPEEGDVLYDGVSVRDLDVSALVGYLPQKISLLDMDITSNVAFGEEEKRINRDRVLSTLQKVNLNDLRGVLDRIVGEDGIKLSGGQKQRIGVARLFYRDKDVILLDEFSSSLDRENEKKLIEEIMSVFNDKTVIAVSHKTYLYPYFNRVYKKDLYSLAEIDSNDLKKL